MAPSELVGQLRALLTRATQLEIAARQNADELERLIAWATTVDNDADPSDFLAEPLTVGRFVLDRSSFSVLDGDRICQLGNTICFQLLFFLANRPNCFFSRQQLLAGVWEGQRRTAATIRSAVFELRQHLRAAGMKDLAAAVRNNGRAYGLTLEYLQTSANAKPTADPTHFQRPKDRKRRDRL